MVEVYPEQSSATGSGTVGTDQMSSIVLKVGEQTSYFLSNLQRNWVYAKNSNFVSLYLCKPDGVNPWYFKLRLFDLTEFIVWKI